MEKTPGAILDRKGTCTFTVWAPNADNVDLIIKGESKPVILEKDSRGYWQANMEMVSPKLRYKFRINDQLERPDPASRCQPEGVHSWSEVIDPFNYSWQEKSWEGVAMKDLIIYELHVGTFTPEGTFEAVLSKLDHLLDLGINCIEIMPISQFPGSRNWGYDGVYPYAAQYSYGNYQGLKKMIDGCHQRGMAVILDVVYNHMGPEGNYLGDFGPYFTEKYHTPWGAAINFDGKYSDQVRNFFLKSAQMWLEEFRFDGLRLDAVQEIFDMGATHFLRDLRITADKVEKITGRKKILIAESDLNDVKLINPPQQGGYGLHAQWTDDFHHSLHTVLIGEREGYYSDYGKISQLEKSFKQAMVYDGAYSTFRERTVGNSPEGIEPEKFVVSIQNHDQVGNRPLGDRLGQLVGFEKQKLAAGMMLIAPYTPMLFMGEEYGEDHPFQYFISHTDPDLVKAVQQGRKREFEYFHLKSGDFPDPQAEETFRNSSLDWQFQKVEQKNKLFKFYRNLIELRKQGAFAAFRSREFQTCSDEKTNIISAFAEGEKPLLVYFNFNEKEQKLTLPEGIHNLKKIIASADRQWLGNSDHPEDWEKDQITLPGSAFIVLEGA